MYAKLSSKNQIVIPKECRESLSLLPGDEILFIPKGNLFILQKRPKSFSTALGGKLKSEKLNLKENLDKIRQNWDE